MNRLILVAFLLFAAFAGFTGAAPDRKPHGPPPIEEAKPVQLNQLPKDGVITFGEWTIAQTSHENGIIIVHRQTRLAVYLPWASNGWINYRLPDGNSYVLWSKGGSDPQQREYEFNRILNKPAQGSIAPGDYNFQTWKVSVTEDNIQFSCSSMGCNMTIPRHESVFVHNGRTLGGLK